MLLQGKMKSLLAATILLLSVSCNSKPTISDEDIKVVENNIRLKYEGNPRVVKVVQVHMQRKSDLELEGLINLQVAAGDVAGYRRCLEVQNDEYVCRAAFNIEIHDVSKSCFSKQEKGDKHNSFWACQ